MIKTPLKDRRSSNRAKRVLSIEYRFIKCRRKNIDTSWQLSTTHDMSLGGVAFYTDQESRVNDLLEIRIIMSGILDIFKGQGKIVRVDQRSGSHYLVAVKLLSQKSTHHRPAKTFAGRKKLSKKN